MSRKFHDQRHVTCPDLLRRTNKLCHVCVLQEELVALVRRLCEALLQELRRLLEEQQDGKQSTSRLHGVSEESS